jgi:hypothetical protein
MKKAKIILSAIAVFAVIGGALAFKTSRFSETQLWTVTGVTVTSTTTAVGGPTYSATIPYCKTVNFFTTDDSPLILTNARLTVGAIIKATRVGGTQTTTIPFTACPVVPAPVTVTLIP